MKAAAFAHRTNCSVQHLHNVENGHKQASPELLHRIARQLGVAVETIAIDDDGTEATETGAQVPA